MYEHRPIYLVKLGEQAVAFEYPDQAEDWAKEVGGTVESVRLYVSGHRPFTWTVYVGEASVNGLMRVSGPVFRSYVTSDVVGIPNESMPCELIEDKYQVRAIGTDEALVAQQIQMWIADQKRALL